VPRTITMEGRAMTKPCNHLDHVRTVAPNTPAGCEECLSQGTGWVHLRLCLECGHVGCCDSSPGKHATEHFHRSGHPVVRSLERGEDWGWCYADQVLLEPAPVPR
jgi:uncharacterized UBP type Zn finger protein